MFVIKRKTYCFSTSRFTVMLQNKLHVFVARYRSLSNKCALSLFRNSTYILTVDIFLKKPLSVFVVRPIGTCSGLMRMKTDHKYVF